MHDNPRPIRASSLPRRAPRGSPNVVVILFDDLGFAQLGCYGSEIATPAIDRLAAGGLRYNRFHVTSLCSPTRAALMTGRNHHAVGMGYLADVPLDLPGYNGHRPKAAGTLPQLLTDAGYSAYAVGKWHLTPRGERSHSGPFTSWPLGWGFEKHYGFLQGDTNQWSPHLVRDNHYVDPPRSPSEGYHLSEDLADTAIRYVHDQQQATPDKPFFLYFSLGAMHAPHHVADEWVAPYKRRFDDGWTALRDRVFARQVEIGLIPEGTTLTEQPSWVPRWDSLSDDDRRLYARMHETYAGFLSHSDAQIGRLIDHLEQIGKLDNTIVVVMSDNGASAEGGVQGTPNEHRFSLRLPESTEANLLFANDWGGFRTYPHYAWGWAWAGNSPFHLWKRYTWLGGTRSPLIVHWPAHITDAGAVRSQIGHVVDIMPTLLESAGVDAPAEFDGVTQQPIDGGSLYASFGDAEADGPQHDQYFELLGSRALISGGWKATTDHVSSGVADEERLMTGSRDFATDTWALFRLDEDFAEAVDVAADHPDVVRELIDLWDSEAQRNGVLPMKDDLFGIGAMLDSQYPRPDRAVYRPGGSPVSDDSLPMVAFGGRVSATVDVPPNAEGVLCALGDWTGGFALYVKDGRPCAVLNIGGEEVSARSSRVLRPGRRDVACQFIPEGGPTRLVLEVDGDLVGEAVSAHGVPFAWQHGGTMLMLGADRGFPVTADYACPFPWNGQLAEVVFEADTPPRQPSARDGEQALHAD